MTDPLPNGVAGPQEAVRRLYWAWIDFKYAWTCANIRFFRAYIDFIERQVEEAAMKKYAHHPKARRAR